MIFGLFLSLFTSCQKEETAAPVEDIATSQALTTENLDQLYADYTAKHGRDVIVKHSTLEEMNALFIEHGMETVSLENLGMTQEEYDAAQINLSSEEGIEIRCDDPVYQFLGDMNGNGYLSTFDIILARNVLLFNAPPSQSSQWFGWITAVWNNNFTPSEISLSTLDLFRAQRIILGDPCP